MILSEPPTIENLPDVSPLRKKALRRLADGEIDFKYKRDVTIDKNKILEY